MKTFLCYSLHQLPDKDTLQKANISLSKQSNYTFTILGQRGKGRRAIKIIQKGQTCIVRPTGYHIELLPLAHSSSTIDTPYGLAYNFWLDSQTFVYKPIASFYGFSIVTVPQDDCLRAQAAMQLQQYTNALEFIDRAFYTLAEAKPERITDTIDKTYIRYTKLLNLYINQPDAPEGQLAGQRAYEAAYKCYTMLAKESN